MIARKNKLPKGWDAARVQRVAEHYDRQTEEQALREDQAAVRKSSTTFMEVPRKLVPAIRKLIERSRQRTSAQ